MSKKLIRRLTLIIGMWLAQDTVMANDINLHGFFSQSFIVSPDNPFYEQSTGNHFNFREFSLSASWAQSHKLRFAGQLLSRRAGSFDDGVPRIDFLLADYNLYQKNLFSTGLRLGRIKVPYGFYNATRDVPHARPGVFVPQTIYFESLRDSAISADGAEFYFKKLTDWGELSLNTIFGQTSIHSKTFEYWLFEKDIRGAFEQATLWGGKLTYSPTFLPQLIMALSYLDFETDIENTPTFSVTEQLNASAILAVNPSLYTDYLTKTELNPRLMLLSLQYTVKDWTFTAIVRTVLRSYSPIVTI